KMADYCVYWFRRAHDLLPPEGRAGLVGTNTIRQNESREASLDYIVKKGGTITEAGSSEGWAGGAQGHVSLVNWLKGSYDGPNKRLYTQLGDSPASPWKVEDVSYIPPSLQSGTDVTGARRLETNEKAKKCFTGQNPVNAGFFLTPTEASRMIDA